MTDKDSRISVDVQEAVKAEKELAQLRLYDRVESILPFNQFFEYSKPKIDGAKAWQELVSATTYSEYKGPNFSQMNDLFRYRGVLPKRLGNSTLPESLFQMWLKARLFMFEMSFYNALTPFATWVFRGTKLTSDQFKKLNNESKIHFESFTSTTSNYQVALNFTATRRENLHKVIFELFLPANFPCRDFVYEEDHDESEIMLPPNVIAKIFKKSFSSETGITTFYAKVEPFEPSVLCPTFPEFIKELELYYVLVRFDAPFDYDTEWEKVLAKLHELDHIDEGAKLISSAKNDTDAHQYIGIRDSGKRFFRWLPPAI